MKRTRTHRARYHFKVAEYSGGETWIAIETLGGDVPPLKDIVTSGFDFRKRMTYEEAQGVARYLNEVFESFSVTVEEAEQGGRGED